MNAKVNYINYYVSGSSVSLTFKDNISDCDDTDSDEELKDEEQEEQPVRMGIIFNAWRINQNYKTLISNLGIDHLSFQELKEYYGLTTKDVDMTIQEQSNKITNNKMIKIIFYYFYKGCIKDEIWYALSEELQQVNIALSKFKRWLKARSRVNMKMLGRRKIILPAHHEFIKSILSTSKNTIMTVSSISDQLKANYGELKDVSLTTIEKCMKKDWRLSYK